MSGLPVEFLRQNECAAQEPAASLFTGGDRQGNIESRPAKSERLTPRPKGPGDPEHVLKCRPTVARVKHFQIEIIFCWSLT